MAIMFVQFMDFIAAKAAFEKAFETSHPDLAHLFHPVAEQVFGRYMASKHTQHKGDRGDLSNSAIAWANKH